MLSHRLRFATAFLEQMPIGGLAHPTDVCREGEERNHLVPVASLGLGECQDYLAEQMT